MKTSILQSLLILATLVIPLVNAEAGSKDHYKHDDKHDNKQQCQYTIEKGNTGSNCVSVLVGDTNIATDEKHTKFITDFTVDNQIKKNLIVKYRMDFELAKDTKWCSKREAKLNKSNRGRAKLKGKYGNTTFTGRYRLNKKVIEKCGFVSATPIVTHIVKGNLGENIIYNDPIVTVHSATADEGGALMFEVTMEGAVERDITLQYSTVDVSAHEGTDFQGVQGEMTFTPPNTMLRSMTNNGPIQVASIDDNDIEGDETMQLTVNVIAGGEVIKTMNIDGVIVDNDTALSRAEQIANLRQIIYTEQITNASAGPKIFGLDIGNDGDQDILAVFGASYDMAQGYAVLYINDNTTETGWTAERIMDTNSGLQSMVVGDFTGDGLDDVFNFNPFGDDVLLVQVDGTLDPVYTIPEEQSRDWNTRGATYDKGYQKDMAKHSAGDIDGDGDLDVFVIAQNDLAGYRMNGHIYYINDGAGNFTKEYRTQRSERGVWFSKALSSTIADFDNDGSVDILIGTGNYKRHDFAPTKYDLYNQQIGNVNVMLGADGMRKATVERTANINTPSDFAVHTDVQAIDLNGDGNMDTVTANQSGSDDGNHRVEVRFGNGDGTFTLSQNLTSGTQGDAKVSLEDVNNDGLIDIVALPFSQGHAYFNKQDRGSKLNRLESVVYVNLGDGVFAEDPSITIENVSIEAGMFYITDDDTYIPVEILARQQ